jgi:hypothetical protein
LNLISDATFVLYVDLSLEIPDLPLVEDLRKNSSRRDRKYIRRVAVVVQFPVCHVHVRTNVQSALLCFFGKMSLFDWLKKANPNLSKRHETPSKAVFLTRMLSQYNFLGNTSNLENPLLLWKVV